MATTFVPATGDAIRPYGRCKIQHFPEAASQTFKRGYPVILDAASTKIASRVSADNPTAAIVGIAAADASGVTGAMCPVWLAKPEYQFQVRTVAPIAIDFTDIGSCARSRRTPRWRFGSSIRPTPATTPWCRTLPRSDHERDADRRRRLEVNAIFHFDPKATIFGAGT
jgi:hypothetical protein